MSANMDHLCIGDACTDPKHASPNSGVAGLVTCDKCNATSEAGWGDTPLCVDCQREEDPAQVCEDHDRTFEGDTCPVCDENEAEYVMHIRFTAANDDMASDLVAQATDALGAAGTFDSPDLPNYVSYEEVLP